MKVAVCISGQLRSWEDCYKTWIKLFDTIKNHPDVIGKNVEFDYFFHIWDFNTIPEFIWREKYKKLGYVKKITPVSKEEIQQIIDIFNPKKYLIQDKDVSLSREKITDDKATSLTSNKIPIKSHISWTTSQLYSIMRCAFLKREYEVENNFEYDVCIRMRFDLSFDDNNIMLLTDDFVKPIKERTIYACHCHNLDFFPHNAIGDIFYYSDSQTYDVITQLYDFLPYIDSNIFPPSAQVEDIFGYYVRMFLLDNYRLNIDPKIKRLTSKLI
jgi:hypothetical protein